MATRTFYGHAIAVKQISTLTIGGTWATSDTVTLTVNGKTLVLTVGTDTTTAQIATAVQEMWEGDTQTGTGDHTYSGDKTLAGEFSRITATVASSVVTFTADDFGVPFTLATTKSSTSGTVTDATPTAATGPSFFSDADNWSGDTVPVDGDDIVFDTGDVDLKYDLNTGIQPASVTIKPSYTGNIGLSKTNADDATLPYDEYREDYLTFANDAGTTTTTIDIEATGSGRIKIDVADCATVTWNIRGSGSRAESTVPSILCAGTHSGQVFNVLKGDVGVAFFEGESGHIATLRVGYLDSETGDVLLEIGGGCDLTDAAIEIEGGTTTIDSTTSSGTITQSAGVLTILSGAHAAIDVDKGTLYYRSEGTITSLDIGNGGVVDFRRDSRARTVSACEVHGVVSIYDPFKTVTWSAGIDFNHCSPTDSTLDFGANVRLTPGAVA